MSAIEKHNPKTRMEIFFPFHKCRGHLLCKNKILNMIVHFTPIQGESLIHIFFGKEPKQSILTQCTNS